MRQFNWYVVVFISAVLTGCGSSSDLPAKPKFTSQVSFGDSLSDVGSYNTGLVASLGGGQFTISIPATPTNWTQLTAAQFSLSNPCAYEVGLNDGTGTPSATNVTSTFNTSCTGYAQGGARVTSPVGIGNSALGGGGFFLTVPVMTQISNHVTAHGGFTGSEIVLVMAGANDIFFQAATVVDATTQAAAITAVQAAATQLAGYVTNQIVGNGAKYVVVVNVPDIGSTPYGASLGANVALINALVSAFNTQLASALPDSANVLNVDAFTANKDEVANAANYNLTNVSGTACNLTAPSPNLLGSSLVCNSANLNTGVLSSDHYLFADAVHPTPYGHALFASYVLKAMTNKGWF